MNKVTRYYRKMQKSFLKVATIVSLTGLILVPTVSNNSTTIKKALEAYSVVVNGQEIGCVATSSEANEAFLSARTELNKKSDKIVYVDAQMEVYKVDGNKKVIEKSTDIQKKIYDKLCSSVIESNKQLAYTVRIDDFTVTLGSEEDVIKVIESVKSKYDKDNMFQVNLERDDYGKLSVKLKDATMKPLDVDKVSAVLNGEKAEVSEITSETVIEEGMLALGFAESIEIIQTSALSENISTVENAYNEITKEKAEKGVYVVVSGDCLYDIAIKHDMPLDVLLSMNEGMTENSIIHIGDEVVVTVPKSELSIITVETDTYEEKYYADVVYIDDPKLYIGQTAVVSEGVPGYRKVDAVVTKKDNAVIESQIIKEEVLSQPTAKVVRRGTTVAPTYIIPIEWYHYISEEYGWRDWTNSFHGALDFASPTGTDIRAARGGYVSYAGWKGSFGNCIEITHPDGHMTRYAHLSGYAVSYGQKVDQWQTIGYCGSTGFSTGPHLHFELWINGSTANPRDWVDGL